MQLTVTTVNGDVFTVEVAQDMEVENLLALCQVEVPSLANVPAERLLLLHNGRTLNKGGQDLKKTIQEIALSDNDMVLVSAASANTAPAGAGGRTGATAALGSSNPLAGIDFSSIRVPQQRGGAASASTAPRPSANANPNDPAVVYQQLLNDAPLRAQLRETNPALSEALESGNFARFSELINRQLRERQEEAMRRIRILTADPMDAEAQRYIEEEIQRENIQHTFETAMEHMPESFGSVHMLYIQCKINGHDIKAFVDSGAQRTIMSADCAKRCNVIRFLDKRFQGFAVGVGGQQKILGRVHMAQIQIESEFLPMSFDVLEDQSMDVLLGLDMLKRHQCMIDLKDNCLRMGDHTMTRFLHENELPAHARLHGGDAKSAGTQEEEDREIAEAMDASAREVASSSKEQQQQQQPQKAEQQQQHPPRDPKIQQLIDMGFSEADASAELLNCAGDVNQAAVRLLAKQLTVPSSK